MLVMNPTLPADPATLYHLVVSTVPYKRARTRKQLDKMCSDKIWYDMI